MENKYINSAIIGNDKIMATYGDKGELLRIYYPTRDNRQFIDFFNTGVKINDSNIIYLNNDINNIYSQFYEENTNVLKTKIKNTYFNLKVIQTDFVMIRQDILVKKYEFINENSIDLDVKFLVHSKQKSDDNNFISCKTIDDGLIQYSHDYSFCIFASNSINTTYQIHNSKNNIESAIIGGKDYIGMTDDSSIRYDLGTIKPQEIKELFVGIYINKNSDIKNISEIEKKIDKLKTINFEKELNFTIQYWRKYVKEHDGLELEKSEDKRNKKIYEIYIRTILLFPLLTNSQTGAMVASPEVDEKFKFCGRYNYCWPRDSVFITKAMDILKMEKETEKFYKVFCKMTQLNNGMWEQRYFTDGTLAPCWGYQIDETASVVAGVYDHYKKTMNKEFLFVNLNMCEKAIHYLEKYVDDVIENTNKFKPSYDLWEMYEGVHLYSLSSIFYSFEAMSKMYDEAKEKFETNRVRVEKISKEKVKLNEYLLKIKEYILSNFYDEKRKTLFRNIDDKRIDISLIGAVIPFELFKSDENIIKNTIENIELSLRTFTSGFKRFENDHYMQGNPWIIATLWIALYYKKTNQKQKEQECLDFVLKSSTHLGFLPEQVDNENMKPVWVNMLGWSHAMFIILLQEDIN